MSDYDAMARYEQTGRVSDAPKETVEPTRDMIFELEGSELESLRKALNRGHLHTLRLHPRRDGFAWKVNEGGWSPSVGTVVPRQ